ALDVRVPAVRARLRCDPAREVKTEAFLDVPEVGVAGGLDRLGELTAVAEELQGLPVDLDGDEEPAAPLPVHAGDLEQFGGDGAVAARVPRWGLVGLLLMAAVLEAACDPVLEGED